MPTTPRVLIAVPVFNESETIANVILECRKACPSFSILVVDDGSTDKTLEIVKELNVEVLELPFNLGVGGAMRTAFRFAAEKKFDFLVQVDGDGQHDPNQIHELIDMSDGVDVCVGSRFFGRTDYEISRTRKFAIFLLSRYLQMLVGLKLTDPTSGFRVSNKRAIYFYAKTYPFEYLADTVGSIVLGKIAGLRFKEIPTLMNQRQGGQPSQSIFKSTVHLARTLFTITLMKSRKNSKVMSKA